MWVIKGELIVSVFKWRARINFEQNAAKNNDSIKKRSKQKMLRIKFPIKKLSGHISLSLSQEWSQWAEKFIFEKLYSVEWESRSTLRINTAKIQIISKNDSNKSCSKLFYKTLGGRISLSPPAVKLRGSKDCHFWNIIMYWNGKVDSL